MNVVKQEFEIDYQTPNKNVVMPKLLTHLNKTDLSSLKSKLDSGMGAPTPDSNLIVSR